MKQEEMLETARRLARLYKSFDAAHEAISSTKSRLAPNGQNASCWVSLPKRSPGGNGAAALDHLDYHHVANPPLPALEGPRFFGLELEMYLCSNKDVYLSKIAHNLALTGKVSFTRDSSLSSGAGGVELMLQPLTFPELEKLLHSVDFLTLLSFATTDQTCGMHINFDLRQTSEKAVANLYGLIALNKASMSDLFGRGPGFNEYCQSRPAKGSAMSAGSLAPSPIGNHRELLAYRSDHRVEFRLPSGSNCPREILTRVQLFSLLLDFCDKNESRLTIPNFAYFVLSKYRKNPKKYHESINAVYACLAKRLWVIEKKSEKAELEELAGVL